MSQHHPVTAVAPLLGGFVRTELAACPTLTMPQLTCVVRYKRSFLRSSSSRKSPNFIALSSPWPNRSPAPPRNSTFTSASPACHGRDREGGRDTRCRQGARGGCWSRSPSPRVLVFVFISADDWTQTWKGGGRDGRRRVTPCCSALDTEMSGLFLRRHTAVGIHTLAPSLSPPLVGKQAAGDPGHAASHLFYWEAAHKSVSRILLPDPANMEGALHLSTEVLVAPLAPPPPLALCQTAVHQHGLAKSHELIEELVRRKVRVSHLSHL